MNFHVLEALPKEEWDKGRASSPIGILDRGFETGIRLDGFEVGAGLEIHLGMGREGNVFDAVEAGLEDEGFPFVRDQGAVMDTGVNRPNRFGSGERRDFLHEQSEGLVLFSVGKNRVVPGGGNGDLDFLA